MDITTYVKLLIDKNSPISQKTQKDIINYIFDVFVQCQNETLYIQNGIIKKIKSKQAFKTIVKMCIYTKFGIDIFSYDKNAKKIKYLIKIDEIYDTVTTINSYDILYYTSDVFLANQKIEKDDVTSTIRVYTNKIHVKKINSININDNDYNAIINDYKKHFKYFDELLDLIIDMRFAKDRKASFLHIRVKSDWGKSFLSGILQNIEIAFEVDYHNLMNKGANDIAPIQIRNSFVLILDEFNNFSQEMKKLSHSFTFAPKFGMSEKVELFLKILLSAEKSPSFMGGVDPQIINRVMMFDIPDNECDTLVSREEYIYQGNAKYMSALEHYASNKIISRINEYLAMPKFEAHKTADNRVRLMYEKYKMDVNLLTDDISNLINDTLLDIANGDENNPFLENFKDNIILITTGDHAGKYFLSNVNKMFEVILKQKASENEFKKMRFKLNDINNIIDIIEDRRKNKIRINGETRQRRGIIVNLKKSDIPIVYKTIKVDDNKEIPF